MILKASQRGGAMQLAAHLLRTDENDHVELHEVKGFVADDVQGAFREAYAISKGTKCQQFLFSLSLSPPQTADVPVEAFEKAIAEIEIRLGLTGQARVIVFHEKQGRRHAHCVWSRIDVDAMKAITRVFDEHGVEMSPAVVDPHSINDMAPRWEPFKALQEKKHEIEAERHELLAYQEKLDQARARLGKGGVTNKELDALDADLKLAMPEAVRDNLAHLFAETDGPTAGVENRTATNPRLGTPLTAPLPSPGLN